MTETPLLDLLQEMEISLHQTCVRNDREQLDRLLHKDFHEIGRSGTFYSKADTIESLPNMKSRVEILARNFKLTLISKDACLLVYEASQTGRDGAGKQYSRRSSIWKLEAGIWQMLFHQGTPTHPFDPG